MGRRSAALSEHWPQGAKKPWGTPKPNKWKAVTAGGQEKIVRGHRPVPGGYIVLATTVPPIKVPIKEVIDLD